MRNQPSPEFVAKVMAVLPADGTPMSARSIFLAIGQLSTKGYVRHTLRKLVISGHVVGTGDAPNRVYRRADALQVAP